MREPPLRVTVLGRVHEVAASLLRTELQRSEGFPRAPLLEAVIRHAPRAQAIARLTVLVEQAATRISAPAQVSAPMAAPPLFLIPVAESVEAEALATPQTPSRAFLEMNAALGLLYLGVRPAEAPQALAALERFARALGGPAGAALLAGGLLLRQGPQALLGAAERDPLLLRQAPRALSTLGAPRAVCDLAALRPLCSAWIEALRRGQKTQGAHAHRGFLGDVCEAQYRLAQRGGGPAVLDLLLGTEERSALQDLVTSELPGTADYLAARPMVWWLGVVAAGAPLDDAAIAAIERARDRFRSEVFHEECALILSGGTWPPAAPPA